MTEQRRAAIAGRLLVIQKGLAAPSPYDQWLARVREIIALLPEIADLLESDQGHLPAKTKT